MIFPVTFILEDFEVVNKLLMKYLSGYQPLLMCKAKVKAPLFWKVIFFKHYTINSWGQKI